MKIQGIIIEKLTMKRQGIRFEIARDIPNTETITAIQEAQAMKKDPALGKAYTDVDAMMKEQLS